ncbi:MAG: hypothetical protein L6Q81_12855 [Bacteroidia bacterium]|nr:hypothetical protein [Bacteroidia bacterium]
MSVAVLAFKPRDTRKLLSNTRWSLNTPVSHIAPGDTVVFKKNKVSGNIFFKSNGSLQEHHWLAYCGNSTRRERRKMNRREWKGIGRWVVIEENAKTSLKLELSNKDIMLERLSQCKDSIVFYTRSVQAE